MSKHTPGPWKCSTFAGQWNVWPTKKHRKSNGAAVAYEMTPEDARLIAAAPLMLEALQMVMAECEAFRKEHQITGEMSAGINAVRAALAASTGEQP